LVRGIYRRHYPNGLKRGGGETLGVEVPREKEEKQPIDPGRKGANEPRIGWGIPDLIV